ncbi:hypothetical protein Sa4125_36570 [Aureimonas sp. SA4125]|uniref:hypothetical protein n=1 Tax=Aureimonas sp. SA4125 TaxID=2826993 RepID=UPI001CC4E07A|nr:hypothetical protein [Aureimonas sp. SA4125]BDA86115.1 hypothetical protein Sa4125_36570 [Aureimonas sp. SA4125]
MPTLVRLLTTLVLVCGLILAAMAALVFFVEPAQHPVEIILPLDQLQPPPAEGEPIMPLRP